MKKTYLLLLLCLFNFTGYSATWYSDPAGTAVNVLTDWWSAAGGTGSNPTSFATAGDIWIIQSNMTMPAGTWTIGGTLQFNSNRIQKGGGGATIINIGGDLIMTANSKITTGTGAGNVTINLTGNLSLTGTSFITNGNVGVSYNYIYFNNTASTLASPQTITWTSTGASLYTGLYVNAGCVVQLNSNIPLPQTSDVGETVNGTLVCGTFVMSSGGTDAFTVAPGAGLYTANAAGINGSVTTMSTTSFSNAANYIFNGVAAQVTGTFLPASIASGGSVTVNNSAGGVSFSQNTSFASGSSLNLQNGALSNTAANLSMAAGANLNRDNGSLAVTPAAYSGINLTYKNLGNNALAVTTGNEFPATFTGNVVVNKPAATITQNSDKTVTGPITLTAGTLDASVSNYNISLTGNWTNNSSATAFTPGSGTVTLNGATAQTVGGSAGTTFSGLTLNNAAGAILGTDELVNSTLTLTAGNLSIGANNLVLGPLATTVAGTPSATNMIIANTGGQVRKQFNANSSFLFPVGDNAAHYSPVSLDFTAGTYAAGAYAGVKVFNVKHPANANVSNYINRYWNVAVSGITTPVYSVSATYAATDVAGTEANISMGQYSAALPWLKFGLTNMVTHTLSAAAITTASSDFSGITTAGPSVSASGSVAFCAGAGPATLTASAPSGDPVLSYSWAPAAGLSATTGVSVTAGPASTTIYTLTITDGNGFAATATAAVTVNPLPAAITGTTSFCNGTASTLSDVTAGGAWTSSNTLVATAGTAGDISGIGAGTTTITYTLSGTGCYVTTDVTINVSPLAISGPTHVCPAADITLTDAAPGGAWSTGAAATALVGTSSGIVTGVAGGVVMISYATPGCSAVTYAVTVDPAPVPISGLAQVCEGASITLSDATPGGSWTSSVPATASIASVTGIMTGIAAGTTLASYTVTATGCFITTAVTVNPVPAAISGGTMVCLGGTLPLADATAGGNWSTGAPGVALVGSSSGVVSGVFTGSASISYTIPVTGCYAVATISVNPPPAAITGANIVCPATTITLADAVMGGVWSSSALPVATVDPVTGIVTGVAGGNATITYNTGCTPAVYAVTVNPAPGPIIGSLNLCGGLTTTLTNASAGGFWGGSNPAVATVVDSNGVVTGVSIGTVVISYIYATTGCFATAIGTVSPAAPVVGTDTLCKGATGYFTDIVGGGSWVSSNPAIATIDPVSGMASAVDSGISYMVYTTGLGCVTSKLLHILRNLPPIDGIGHVCVGSAITLTDSVSGGTWSSDNTFVANIGAATGVLSGLFADTVHIAYTKPYGCMITKRIAVTPLPVPAVIHDLATQSLSAASYYTSYQWYDTVAGPIAGAIADTFILPATNGHFYVTVTDTNGCTGSSAIYTHNALDVKSYSAAGISIYPNPSEGVIYVKAPVRVNIVISSIDGRSLLEIKNATKADISELADGMYFITLYDDNGNKVIMQKIIKRR